MKPLFISICLFYIVSPLGLAEAPADSFLNAGDPAPKFQPLSFVQGEPVKELEPGKTYLIEFWATWCGPCIASIPRLNEISEKFKEKGLIVIGQNVREQDTSKVPDFVQRKGVNYRIALDNSNKMAKTWLEAAKAPGIPTSFLINKDGKIAWIGHPSRLKDQLIEQILAGSFNIAQFAAQRKDSLSETLKEQQKTLKDSAAKQAKALAERKEVAVLANSMQQQMAKGQWDLAQSTLAQILETPFAKNAHQEEKEDFNSLQFIVLVGKGDLRAAADFSLKKFAEDEGLTTLDNAYLLLLEPNPPQAAIEAAEKIASHESFGDKNSVCFHILARAAFMRGDKGKALELQQKAIDCATKEDPLQELQGALESYKLNKLPKEKTLEQQLAGDRSPLLGAIEQQDKMRKARIQALQEENLALEEQLGRAYDAANFTKAVNLIGKLQAICSKERKAELEELLPAALIMKEVEAKNWDAANTLLEHAEAASKKPGQFLVIRVRILLGKGKIGEAVELAKQVDANEENKGNLISFCYALLEHENLPKEGLEVALAMALKANQEPIEDAFRWWNLRILGRAYFLNGDITKAIETTEKALALSDDPETTKQIEEAIKSYRSGQLPK